MTRIYLIFFSLLLLIQAKAQDNGKTLLFGPKAGINLTNFYGDVSGNNSYPRFTVGGFINYNLSEKIALGAEVLYTQKGTEFQNVPLSTYSISSIDYKQHINYIEVPVIGRFYLLELGNIRANVMAGPAVSYRLKANQQNRDIDGAEVKDIRNKSSYKRFDLGLSGGLGVVYDLGEMPIFLDIRYTHGLIDITKKTGDIVNTGISFTIGAGF